jgi:hypothetical protein
MQLLHLLTSLRKTAGSLQLPHRRSADDAHGHLTRNSWTQCHPAAAPQIPALRCAAHCCTCSKFYKKSPREACPHARLQMPHEGGHDALVHVWVVAQVMQARRIALITVADGKVDGK